MSISVVREPRITSVEFTRDSLVVHLADGRILSVPIEWFPRLAAASSEALEDWRLIGHGVGIHWEQLDEDLSVRGLLQGSHETTPLPRAS